MCMYELRSDLIRCGGNKSYWTIEYLADEDDVHVRFCKCIDEVP